MGKIFGSIHDRGLGVTQKESFGGLEVSIHGMLNFCS